MTLDIILFGLRVITGMMLLAFMGALFWVMWRELDYSSQQVSHQRRIYGQLRAVTLIDHLYIPEDTHYPIMPLTTIGRALTNQIIVDEPFVSSEHALISLRDGQWWLEDRNSHNGTTLNDERIQSANVITNDDIIGFGRKYFKFNLYA